MDFRGVVGAFCFGFVRFGAVAQGEEVIFDGADPVQTPAVGRDALGELGFHRPFGREALDD